MKTIGYGCIQVPLLSSYRDTFLRKRDLSGCVAGTAGKMIFQNALRMTLLCVWGLQNVNYSYPRSEEKMFAIYVEMATLGVGILVGVITVFAYFFRKIPLLYPALVSIPTCFAIDFCIKATCYAYLFLYPYITMFGIFSLIEIWWRHLTLLYHWLALISFIYTSKDFVDPFKGKRADVPSVTTVTAVTAPTDNMSSSTKDDDKSCVLKSYKPTEMWTEIKQPADESMEQDYVDGDLATVRSGSSHSLRYNSGPINSDEPQETGKTPKRKGGFIPDILKESTEVSASQIEFECADDVGFAPESKTRRSWFRRKSSNHTKTSHNHSPSTSQEKSSWVAEESSTPPYLNPCCKLKLMKPKTKTNPWAEVERSLQTIRPPFFEFVSH